MISQRYLPKFPNNTPYSCLPDWISVDLFAGGGGASTGMEWALGKSPDIAINHDPEALAMHRANHPNTHHLCQNLIQVNPLHATGGRRVNILWASPDCTHFSKAKGGKPRDQFIRDLAWVVIRWAEEVRPRFIFVENVEEFQTWGPLDKEGQPIKSQSGTTFRSWVKRLRRLGYRVDWRELRACDFGAPTTRKRLFIAARRDGKKIRWPKATHGPRTERPWRTAAECIDWDDRAPSIFERKKPLAINTQRRIAEGIRRYVLAAEKPFLVTYYGPKKKDDFRGQSIGEPVGTMTGTDHHSLVSAHMVKMRGTNIGGPVDAPLQTISAQGTHHAVCAASLCKYYGEGGQHGSLDDPMHTATSKARFALQTAHLQQYNSRSEAQPLDEPMPTVPTRDRFGLTAATLCQYNGRSECQPLDEPIPTLLSENKMGLVQCALSTQADHYEEVKVFLRKWGVIRPDDEAEVMVDGIIYRIVDIGLRMLRPRELFTANGFPAHYIIDPVHNGKRLGITSQVEKCGNSVPPEFAEAIIAANCHPPSDEERASGYAGYPLFEATFGSEVANA